MTTISDIVKNILMAYYGIIIELYDPYDRAAVEEKLKGLKMHYVTGYNENSCTWSYGVYFIGHPVKEHVHQFIDWFKTKDTWQLEFTKHYWFHTKMLVLYR